MPVGMLASLGVINMVCWLSLTLEAETVLMAFWLLPQAAHASTLSKRNDSSISQASDRSVVRGQSTDLVGK